MSSGVVLSYCSAGEGLGAGAEGATGQGGTHFLSLQPSLLGTASLWPQLSAISFLGCSYRFMAENGLQRGP